jgi:single-strand DNA-binding protein
MFGDVNKVILMGNVTNDPDLRFTPSGSAVLNFGIATNRSYRKDETWENEVTYHNIVVWRNAEALAQRIKKGTRVYIEGRLQTRSWENAEGQKQYKTEVNADNVILVARYNEGENSGYNDTSTQATQSSNESNTKVEESSEDTINPDDLPF